MDHSLEEEDITEWMLRSNMDGTASSAQIQGSKTQAVT